MPVSIVTSLLLWSALLTPGARPEPVPSVSVDRTKARLIVAEPIATIRSWPIQDEYSWTISEADTQEEETGDGDPDGISSDAVWDLLPPTRPGQASTVRAERGFASPLTRSPILRC
jgi:hypothetical protein